MTCPETAPALGAYVLGALEPEERRRFDEHLARCPACADELAEFRALPALQELVLRVNIKAPRTKYLTTPVVELVSRVAE